MPAQNTGGWSSYQAFTVATTSVTGTYDVFIVFKDREGGVINLDWMEFSNYDVANVAVTGVSVSPTSETMASGETMQLAPVDATNQNVSWSSSNTVVATVNSSGQVMARKAGTSVITVTTADGSYTAQSTINSNRRNPGDVIKMEAFVKYLDR